MVADQQPRAWRSMAEPESQSQKGTDAARKLSINGSRNVGGTPTHVVPDQLYLAGSCDRMRVRVKPFKTNSAMVE